MAGVIKPEENYKNAKEFLKSSGAALQAAAVAIIPRSPLEDYRDRADTGIRMYMNCARTLEIQIKEKPL